MADDGTGHSVNIPSFMIRKKEGELIKASATDSSQTVYVKAELEIAHPDNRVEYELWYSSSLDLNFDLVRELQAYQSALTQDALFTPRILSYSCKYCDEQVKQNQCIIDGEYCAYLPKGVDQDSLST